MIERMRLNQPTPLQAVSTSWSEKAGVKLFVKRDDLIDPHISGNKWRKLSGILEYYEGFERIITFGGAYSNHLVATAKAGHVLGLRSTAIIRGEESRHLNMVLLLCKSYGMELTYISRAEYREAKRRQGVAGKVLYIPEGGACLEGTWGCEGIVTENEKLDHYVIACGTGTTLAGVSKALEGAQSKLWGIPVLRSGAFIAEDVKNLNGQENFELLLDFHFGGYARTSPELMTFCRQFSEETSILLDPVYTAKAFFAAKHLVETGQVRKGESLGLIHTGGLTGWYGKWQEAI